MYLAIDTGRVNSDIQRIAMLIRRFDDIHGRFVSLSRQIDFEVRNSDAVRTALRALENDMECIRRALKKVQDISEEIVAGYLDANKANMKICSDLVADIGVISRRISTNDPAGNYSYSDYIGKINEDLRIPVSVTAPIDSETLERYGMKAAEADLDDNVPVLTWSVPKFN